MNTPHLTSLEILEDRIAPAGVITLTETAPGVVSITGDALANDISVLQAGPGIFRFEPAAGTTLNVTGTGVVSSFTTNKLITLTVDLGDSGDDLTLTNLTTLTDLNVNGGAGSDDFTFTNLNVKGDATVNTGDGFDDIVFEGLSTAIKGNLNLGFGANNPNVEFRAEKTTIGGTLRTTGGAGIETITASGAGSITIGKGIESNAGATGQMTFNFQDYGATTLGKLPTGESMLLQGAGSTDAIFTNGDVTLAGGVRFTGGAGSDGVVATNETSNIKIGKLPSGESFLFDGGAGVDRIDLEGLNISLAGGILFNAQADVSDIRLTSPHGKVSVGKMAGGASIELNADSGDQLIRLEALKVILSGGIEMNGGGNANTIQLLQTNGVASIGKLAGGASIKHGGDTGNDTITLGRRGR